MRLAVTAQAATTALPPCPPGTPVPAPPVVTHASLFNDALPPRIVAGRPFSIEYDDPTLVTAVQQTIGPPGTVIRDDIGGLVELTLPSPGAVTMTVVYYVVRNGTCTFSSTYTLNVDAGDPVPAGIGATREFSPRGGFAPKKLPRFGDYDGGRPPWPSRPTPATGPRRAGAAEPGAAHGGQRAQAPLARLAVGPAGRPRPVRVADERASPPRAPGCGSSRRARTPTRGSASWPCR